MAQETSLEATITPDTVTTLKASDLATVLTQTIHGLAGATAITWKVGTEANGVEERAEMSTLTRPTASMAAIGTGVLGQDLATSATIMREAMVTKASDARSQRILTGGDRLPRTTEKTEWSPPRMTPSTGGFRRTLT